MNQVPFLRVGCRKVALRDFDIHPGIPDSIKDKIFQPFVKAKPAGHGAKLGLSLSYHIIGVHCEDFRVESNDRKDTTMIIHLPAS
jgi:signal transduction histidine kinase